MRLKKFLFYTFISVVTFLLLAAIIYLLLPTSEKMIFLKIVGIIVIAVLYLVIFVDLIFLLPTVGGAIYLPSEEMRIRTIIELAKIRKGERAIDIGSGDGRLVRALAKAGAKAFGCEINPFLVLWSKWKLKTAPQNERGSIYWQNLWLTNFSEYQVVTLFGMTYIMNGLEKKLMKELKPGARVLCNSFPFPNWKPEKKVGSVYLYIQKSQDPTQK